MSTHRFSSIIKRSELLTCRTTQRRLEIIVLIFWKRLDTKTELTLCDSTFMKF